METSSNGAASAAEAIDHLGRRSIVLVGLMGAGKTAIGRRVAQVLDLPFTDSDQEIEKVSRLTVPELFDLYGEAEFRSLEERVIARLLEGGPQVVSTGGGAFMNERTRRAIAANGVSVWLKADLDTLMNRVVKRQNRPLLKHPDPRAVMRRLMTERHPVYELADIVVTSRDVRRDIIASEVIETLAGHLRTRSDREGNE
jgi:shikimate kinase